MIIYCIAVTFFAAFLAGFLAANLRPTKKKTVKNEAVVKSKADKTLENFLNYNGEIQ